MSDKRPFDLYKAILALSAAAEWIDEIQIFGSRRYLSNSSYGSDIDLLVVPNRQVQIDKLRDINHEDYIDAFLLDGEVAISSANETRINLDKDNSVNQLNAVRLWSRARGWETGQDYRFLDIIPDKNPAKTVVAVRPIILFCALASEFEAVRKRLGDGVTKTHAYIPPYYRAHVRTNSGRERLVIAVQTGVAGVSAGISATRILDYFDHPEFAVLVGITAGLSDDRPRHRIGSWFRWFHKASSSGNHALNLGDILVPTATVDVEAGKVTPKGKEPAGLTSQVAHNLHRAIASWTGFNAWSQKWPRNLKGVTVYPRMFSDCTLACTASVIAYGEYAQSLKRHNRKIKGIEMEAVGIATACQGRCDFLVVKSISDWADEEKGDDLHSYCTQISSDLVISMIEDETL
jgi:nucleoside phosphorylase